MVMVSVSVTFIVIVKVKVIVNVIVPLGCPAPWCIDISSLAWAGLNVAYPSSEAMRRPDRWDKYADRHNPTSFLFP